MSYRLPHTEEKATYVRDRFDEIARHYDLFNDLITQGQHRYWKRILIKKLGVAPGDCGADVCCGTGDIAQRARNAMGESGKLYALDFSGRMLEIARSRLSSQDALIHPIVMQGDAMRLPFADNSLRFISMGYGLRNVTDLDACLREILRVLVPGGIFGSLDVGKVSNPLIAPFSQFYMFRIVPWIGRMLQPGQEMYTYLPHSTKTFPSQQALAEQMRQAGFEEVEVKNYIFGASAIHLARKPGGN